MRRKKLAGAALLMALLMPLGTTPLAVYAEENTSSPAAASESTSSNAEGLIDSGESQDNVEDTSTASNDEKKSVAESESSSSESDQINGDTVSSNAVTLESKDAVDANGIVTTPNTAESENTNSQYEENSAVSTNAPATLGEGEIELESTGKIYDNIVEAVTAAQSGDTLYLGEGNFTLYNVPSGKTTKGKDLTFVGSGVDSTAWNIGAEVPDPKNYGTEYNGDYSFDGAGTITFKDMTLRSGKADYLGFIRADKTVTENCTINGKTFYWGYTSASFRNTVFNAPSYDYALWTYTSPTMTFDGCTFNATGKVINVYTDYSAGKHDITVNFNNCIVNSKSFGKQALTINDSNMGKYKYILNITGDSTTNTPARDHVVAARDSTTCSQIFGFGGKASSNNTGRTDVYLDGALVWTNGKMVTHNYTDGEHDAAFATNYGEWSAWIHDETTPHRFIRSRTVTKVCRYCKYTETLDPEVQYKWEYLLRYDLNGGTGAEGVDYSDRYYSDETGRTAVIAAEPSRAGYVFAGWKDADGNSYASGDTITVDHDTILTAQWNKLVTVSFDLCGHGGANGQGVPSQTFIAGGKASEPAALREDGWVFGGWYIERNCQHRFNFDGTVDNDIVLYAKWDRVAVTAPSTAASAPTAAPAATPAPNAKPAAAKAAIPQTSDVFPLEGLVALFVIGMAGAGTAWYLRKKHR